MTAPSLHVLQQACEQLSTRDPALAVAFAAIGVPVWRAAQPNYQTLARAVTYQLISTRAAAAIWGRTLTLFDGEISPQALLGMADEKLRECGNSRPKIAHMKSIATAITTGSLCFDRLQASEPGAARKELLAVKGIGPWTADLFLMNALGVVDAFPVGDVGVMEAYRALSGAKTRHHTKAFTALAEQWRPYRGVAAHLLWGWLNAQRSRAQT